MGKINIYKLKINTLIGVNKLERIIKQPLYFDVEINYNSEAAQMSDNVQYAVDYFEVAKKIKKYVKSTSFFLIEKLCNEVLNQLLQNPFIIDATVTIFKPRAIFSAKNVSFSLSMKNNNIV